MGTSSHFYDRLKFGLTRRRMLWLSLSSLTAACTAQVPTVTRSPSPTSTSSNETLEIWWTKGLILEEDKAIQKIVQEWQQQRGIPINLSFHKQDDILLKLERADQAGNLPDILYAYKGDLALHPRFAWEGKLVDLSDVIEPAKAFYGQTALEAVSFYNKNSKKRSYYALPLSQEATYVFYQQQLVEQAGLGDRSIPDQWDEFWNYWKEVQNGLRAQNSEVYGLGIQSSPGNSDTYVFFEHILQAYNVQLLDEQGNLQLHLPDVRAGIIRCLKWYTQFYQQGYVPPTATKWLTPDNNRALLNQQVVMTVNPSMSIPVSQQNNQEVYLQQLGTLELPKKPDGSAIEHLISVNQAVILASSQKQEIAKAFLASLTQPNVLQEFVQSSRGRFFPVMPTISDNAFWTNQADPHLSVLSATMRDRSNRLFHSVQAPAYSQVFQQDVWGQAIHQVATGTTTPEQAADKAIQQIQEIFVAWQ